MKKGLMFIFLVFTLVGCSKNSFVQKDKEQGIFKKVDNTNLVVGDKKSKYILEYSEIDNNSENKKLKIYFDEKNKIMEFDLCKNSGKYQYLKSVTVTPTGGKVPNFIDKKEQCTGTLSIKKLHDNNFKVFSKLDFLEGFQIDYFKSYAVYNTRKELKDFEADVKLNHKMQVNKNFFLNSDKKSFITIKENN